MIFFRVRAIAVPPLEIKTYNNVIVRRSGRQVEHLTAPRQVQGRVRARDDERAARDTRQRQGDLPRELDVQAGGLRVLCDRQAQVCDHNRVEQRVLVRVLAERGRQELPEVLRKSVKDPAGVDVQCGRRDLSRGAREEHNGRVGERQAN
jgi:hypothetical protein